MEFRNVVFNAARDGKLRRLKVRKAKVYILILSLMKISILQQTSYNLPGTKNIIWLNILKMPANYIFPLKRFHKLSTVPLLWQMEAVLDLTPKVREYILKKVLFQSCQKEYFWSCHRWGCSLRSQRGYWAAILRLMLLLCRFTLLDSS